MNRRLPEARRGWREQLLLIATLVAFAVLASHPALRLLLPLLDAVGLDLFLVLFGGPLWYYAAPVLLGAWHHVLRPCARHGYRATLFVLGITGPYAEACVAAT